MLQIKCDQCGQTLKGKDVKVTTVYAYVRGVKYQDYDVTCPKCGGVVVHDRYAKKAAENMMKALAKVARKTNKSVKQITEAEKYDVIMLKVRKRAKELALCHKSNTAVTLLDLNKAIDELPQEEKNIVLAYEDKQDVALLQALTHKPIKHIKHNAILLLTQGIIESAIAENDEDFFKSEYGVQIVDTYNTTLTIHASHDYGITADLLLEKMRKNAIEIKGENEDENQRCKIR